MSIDGCALQHIRDLIEHLVESSFVPNSRAFLDQLVLLAPRLGLGRQFKLLGKHFVDSIRPGFSADNVPDAETASIHEHMVNKQSRQEAE